MPSSSLSIDSVIPWTDWFLWMVDGFCGLVCMFLLICLLKLHMWYMTAIASLFHFQQLTEGRSARDIPKQLSVKKNTFVIGSQVFGFLFWLCQQSTALSGRLLFKYGVLKYLACTVAYFMIQTTFVCADRRATARTTTRWAMQQSDKKKDGRQEGDFSVYHGVSTSDFVVIEICCSGNSRCVRQVKG